MTITWFTLKDIMDGFSFGLLVGLSRILMNAVYGIAWLSDKMTSGNKQ